MRLNNINPYNEKKKDYFGYGVIAVACGFICYFFLNILARVVVAVALFIYKYWWVSLIVLVLIIFVKKRRRKK